MARPRTSPIPTLRRRPRVRRVHTAVALLAALAVLGGCAGSDAPGTDAVGTTVAPGTTAPAKAVPKPRTDQQRADASLLSAKDLGADWTQKPKPATVPPDAPPDTVPGTTPPGSTPGTNPKAKPSGRSSLGTSCPDLTAKQPALGLLDHQVEAQAGQLNRAKPETQVTDVVYVFGEPADAAKVAAVFRDPSAPDCVKSLLGRQPGSGAAPPKSVTVSPWDLGQLGTDRIGFDVGVTDATAKGDKTFHLGFALVQYQRGLVLVAIFANAPMGQPEADIVGLAAVKMAVALRK